MNVTFDLQFKNQHFNYANLELQIIITTLTTDTLSVIFGQLPCLQNLLSPKEMSLMGIPKEIRSVLS